MLIDKIRYFTNRAEVMPGRILRTVQKKDDIMQLNMTTDYAIRSILYIAESGGNVTVEEISDKMGISLPYMRKLFYKLTKAGLIEAYRGRNGGYFIARPAEELSLWDIANVTEQTMAINICLENQEICSRNTAEECTVRQFFLRLQSQMEEEMKKTTIRSLADKATERRERGVSADSMKGEQI